jgi:hypothetical protein
MVDLKAVRRRLYDDYEFYAKSCIHIRTKAGEVKPLLFNSAQKKLHAAVENQYQTTGKVRIIILKARQQGFSTWVHGRMYSRLSQRKAKKGLVVAHVADSTRALFDMYRRSHEMCPEAVKPATKYSSRRELSFPKLDTFLIVATAGGDGVARGETLTNVHLSEVAFWPKATAADNLNGLLQSIPDQPDTEVYIESTANGMSGPFYDLWKGAVEGKNDFIPFFSPWFDSDEYRVKAPEHFEPTLDELDQAALYGLDNDQLNFRRIQISKSGLDKFRQEYPSNATEAFIASGRPVFNPDQIHKMLSKAKPPEYRMEAVGETMEKHPRGELSVWYDLEPNERYCIGADVAMGLNNGDYSVAQVLDSQKRLVASWRGHIHPDYFATVLYALGMYYNEARVAVENNAHGLLTAVRLGRDLAYPNTYTEIGEGTLNDRDTFTIGFSTNSKSKPMVVDKLRAAMREEEIDILDEVTLKEMLAFVVTEGGRMTAEVGNHDDTIMSLAIANHVHDGKFTPIPFDDAYYVEAI